MQPHLLRLPKVDELINLQAITDLAQQRLCQYGSVWIIRSISVYIPLRQISSDPYKYLWGSLSICISPQIEKPQFRYIGFPNDKDFSWNYIFNTRN